MGFESHDFPDVGPEAGDLPFAESLSFSALDVPLLLTG